MRVFIRPLLASSLLIAISALMLTVLQAGVARVHDGKVYAEDVAPAEQTKQDSDEEAYKYVAQPGDTYTAMARKAIQTYGIENSVNLSGAEIIYAETNLTLEAGSPRLVVGQEVTISRDTVHKWVDSAQALDDAAEAKWNYFVQFVNFNTDLVGEVRS